MREYPRKFDESYAPDRLFAGLTQQVTVNAVLLAGQNLRRGALLGRVTATGKLTLSTAAATDGSQVPYAVLADEYDATASDLANVAASVKGEFNERAVIYGAGHSAASVRDALRDGGIYLVQSEPA